MEHAEEKNDTKTTLLSAFEDCSRHALFFFLSAISDQQIFFNFIKSPILQFDMTDKHCATDWNACWKKKKKKNFFWAT